MEIKTILIQGMHVEVESQIFAFPCLPFLTLCNSTSYTFNKFTQTAWSLTQHLVSKSH